MNHSMTMRRLLGAVAALALFIGLLPATAGAETLRVAVRGLPPAQGNPFTGRGIPHVFVWTAMFDYMVEMDAGGNPLAGVAESWKNIDKDTWQFTLRPNVTYANGEKLNAAAVKSTMDWLIKTDLGKTSVAGRDMITVVRDVSVVSDLVIEIKTVTPNPITPKRMGAVAVVPTKSWADMGPESFARNPVTAGPYKIVQFKPGEAEVEAYPRSWRKITGNIDRIRYLELPEPPARVAALQGGQVDIDVQTSNDAVDQLRRAGFTIDIAPPPRTIGLSIVSMRKKDKDAKAEPVNGPMADVRVRRALNHAVNKQSIVDNIFKGNGAVVGQMATRASFGFNPDIKPYAYDIPLAKKLLAEAGYPNGLDLEARASAGNATFDLIYQSGVQDLQAAGVRVKFSSQPFPEWLQFWLGGNWPYDLFGFGADLTSTLDASQSFKDYTSCLKESPYYCNEAEMPLINAALSEFDQDKRKKLLQDLLKINAENAPIVFLAEVGEPTAFTSKLKNFKQANTVFNYHEMVLQK
ncbi:MAG: ABC transporter substrate-binding protein [Alphaproteobacteria bacterium]|nr:ABC transporter substrate-binding protein [Alphaproteobacteria bacterium]